MDELNYKNKEYFEPIVIEGLNVEITKMEDAQKYLVNGYLKLDIFLNSQKKELDSISRSLETKFDDIFQEMQRLHSVMEKEYETSGQYNVSTITLLNEKRNEIKTLTDNHYKLMKKYYTEIMNMNTLLKIQSLPDFEETINMASAMEVWKSGAAF